MREEAELFDAEVVYEFDRFRVDPMNRLLWRDDEVVPLTSKVFDILLVFVENSGRLLEKDEVMQKVWRGGFVEEGNLTRNISTLRKALGEAGKSPQYIVTVPGRGYKFVAPVRKLQLSAPRTMVDEPAIAPAFTVAKINSADRIHTSRASGTAVWKSRALVAVALALAGVAVVAFFLALSKRHESNSINPPIADARPQLVKFTTTGNVVFGSLSPDGKFAAYVALEADNRQAIWIKHVASGSTLCVQPAVTGLSYWGLTFSPDSNFLYYVVDEHAPLDRGVLYRLPIVGGVAERLLTGISTHPSFSPDGRQMVYKRPSHGQHELVVADADGHNPQVWATGASPYDFWTYGWSPKGETIAYANSRADDGGRYWYIAEMSVTGGAERVISKRRYKAIRGMEWLPDGRSLVIVAEDPTSGLFQLWRLFDDGTERRLTNDVNDYWRVSVTADGSALLTSQQERPSNIFVASMAAPRRARQVTPGIAGYDTLAWTPDGHLIYSSFNNGLYNLWTMEADGSGQRPLTVNAGHNKFPAISADGRTIVFVSNRAGRFSAWRMESDGSAPRQIGGETTGRVQCSPDGRQAFYTSDAAGNWALWKVALEGGEPERVRDLYFYRASLSPDGTLLAYTYLDEASGRVRLAISPINSPTPLKTFDADIGYEVIRWIEDGNAVAYISGKHELRIQPIGGGKPRVLLTVPDELFSFDMSRDGQQIAYISGRVTNDLVLIRNF